MEEINGYKLSRVWFDFIFESDKVVTPTHTALYFWIIELNNLYHWKPIFGLRTSHSMEALGIKSYRAYKKALDDLESWGFIKIVSRSHNQHSCNQVALVLKAKAETKAEAKAQPKPSSHNKTKKPKNKETLYVDAFSIDYISLNNFDALAYKLWKQCYDYRQTKNIKPTILNKAVPERWANDIRLLIDTDKRTEEEYIEILAFLKKDSFWSNTIQSPDGLRRNFEKIQLQMRSGDKHKKLPQEQYLETQKHDLKPSDV